MQIILYKFTGENKLVDKASSLSTPLTYNGYLKEGITSIKTPSILLKEDVSNLIGYNYCYIQSFNRYYFITNISSVNNQMSQIDLRVDVLYSNKTDILLMDAYVDRNENIYNDLIKDDWVDFVNKKSVEKITSGITTISGFTTNYSSTSNPYVVALTCIIKNLATNTPSTLPLVASLPECSPVATIYNGHVTTYLLQKSTFLTLCNEVFLDDTLRSYIISCVVLPYEPQTTGQTLTQIEVGDKTILGSAKTIKYPYYEREHRFSIYYNPSTSPRFLMYEPFSNYEIYLPYYGYYKIDTSQLLNVHIKVFYQVNYYSGQGTIILYNDDTLSVIDTLDCKLGMIYSFNSSNALEVKNQKINSAIQGTLSLLSSGLALASGNPVMAIGGMIGGASAIAKTINSFTTAYNLGSAQVNDGSVGYVLEQTPYIRHTYYLPTYASYDDFKHIYGAPLKQVIPLNTLNLTGFTQIENLHFDKGNATEGEKTEIEELFKNGVIL